MTPEQLIELMSSEYWDSAQEDRMWQTLPWSDREKIMIKMRKALTSVLININDLGYAGRDGYVKVWEHWKEIE